MPRRASRSRGIARLSQPVRRELSLYALAAGAAGVSALALSQPAQAQIVYTPDHQVLEAGSTVSLDFNHDGTADVTIVDRVTKGRSGSLTFARGSFRVHPHPAAKWFSFERKAHSQPLTAVTDGRIIAPTLTRRFLCHDPPRSLKRPSGCLSPCIAAVRRKRQGVWIRQHWQPRSCY